MQQAVAQKYLTRKDLQAFLCSRIWLGTDLVNCDIYYQDAISPSPHCPIKISFDGSFKCRLKICVADQTQFLSILHWLKASSAQLRYSAGHSFAAYLKV